MSDDSSDAKTLPWSPLTGIALIVGLYFLAPVLGSMLLAPFISGGLIDSNGVFAQFLYITLVESFTVAGLIFFLRRKKRSVVTLGLNKFRVKYVLIGLAVYPLYFIFFAVTITIATRLFPALNVDQQQQLGFDSVHGALPLILTFISLVILPPLVEELTVRGLLFTSLRSKLPFIWAMLLTSVIFAAAHLPEGGSSGPLYIAAIDTFSLSLMLCLLREKTGSLWPGITLHALKNGIAYLSLYILVLR